MSSLSGGFSYLKKCLLKSIDLERADSKGLKTLALCWVNRKRAFSVSGQFRKAPPNSGKSENPLKVPEKALHNNGDCSFGSSAFPSSQTPRLQF